MRPTGKLPEKTVVKNTSLGSVIICSIDSVLHWPIQVVLSIVLHRDAMPYLCECMNRKVERSVSPSFLLCSDQLINDWVF